MAEETRDSVSSTQLITAGLLVVRHRKLLLAWSKNKAAWYLPGGKTMTGETTLNALIREVSEELNIELDRERIRFYAHITAPAFGEEAGVIMEQDCFLYDLNETPQPAAEIEALQYAAMADYRGETHQVPGVVMIMEQLKADGLID